jgi:hypothetical protein
MKLFIAIKSAAFRTLKSVKGVLIIWFLSLLLVSLVVFPLKGILISGFGKSMITEKLAEGINIEVFTDLSSNLKNLLFSFSRGLLILILTGFLMNTFLCGGLFDSLKGSTGKFSAGEFFKASAKNFWSFLFISLIINIIIFFLAILLVMLPISVVSNAAAQEDGAVLKTGIILIPIFLLLVVMLFLVIDYARAWQVSADRNECFKALGFGFRQTFRTFLSSYPLMIILLIVQVLYGLLVLNILPGMKPVTGNGVFLLFLLSQFLFFVKILLKAWRYGSVTSLMEQNSGKASGFIL